MMIRLGCSLVSWCHEHFLTLLELNMIFVIDTLWFAQESQNIARIQIQAVPPNHSPIGLTVVAHMDV